MRDLGVDGALIWTGWKQVQVVASFEHANGLSDSIEGGKYIDQLSDHKPLNMDSAQWG